MFNIKCWCFTPLYLKVYWTSWRILQKNQLSPIEYQGLCWKFVASDRILKGKTNGENKKFMFLDVIRIAWFSLGGICPMGYNRVRKGKLSDETLIVCLIILNLYLIEFFFSCLSATDFGFKTLKLWRLFLRIEKI